MTCGGDRRTIARGHVLKGTMNILRDSLQRRLWLAFATAALLAAIPAWLVILNNDQLNDDRDTVSLSHRMITTLADTLMSLQDVQASGRGYALAGDTSSLQRYNDAVARFDGQVDALRLLAANDPVRSGQVETLGRLAETAIEQSLTLGHSETVMDDVREIVATIRTEEGALIESRNDASDAATQQISLLSGSLVIVSLMLLGSTLFAAGRAASSSRKAAEAASEIGTIVDASNDAIISTSPDGTIRSWNRGAEAMFGYAPDEAIGQHVSLIATPGQDPEVAANIALVRAGTAITNQESVRLTKDGSLIDVSLSAAPIRGASGDVTGVAAIIRDIMDRKHAAAELERARAAAEAANQAKSTFLSRMSHELRTPLNVVLGFGQVLQLDPLEPEQAEAVDHILGAGRHLLDLIDEVLDVARIEAGRLTLSIETLRASEVLADAVSLMHPLADERGVSLGVPAAAGDSFIHADRQRLKQVLLNLLSNGIKYNQQGGTVEVSCQEVLDRHLRIAVSDTGMGIEPEKMQRLFTPFDRLGAEGTGVEGTGLGLALSKHLIEAMDGAIGAESTPGIGSTFWVELPLAEADSALPPPSALPATGDDEAEDMAVHTILYIEDNLANLKLMERILPGRRGGRLLTAMRGSLGLQLARDHHPDLVLLDLHLPDMPGTDVLRELQLDPATRDIPVVIVSADATPGQVALLLAAGARAYLTKPVDVHELLSVTGRLLRKDA
jgi:PAS domain S-box-containing protein